MQYQLGTDRGMLITAAQHAVNALLLLDHDGSHTGTQQHVSAGKSWRYTRTTADTNAPTQSCHYYLYWTVS